MTDTMTASTPLHKLIETASHVVDTIFHDNNEILPMYHVILCNGQHALVPSLHRDKDASIAMIQSFFELFPTQRYVFISEAWTVLPKWPTEQTPSEIRPSQHPDKVEIISFLGEDRNLGMLPALRNIIRPPNGKPHLGPLEFLSTIGSQMEGRMVGLLPRDAKDVTQ